MLKPFQTVAVLGAGVMGSQIAAHLANAGLRVHLLDLPAPPERGSDRPAPDKNALIKKAFKQAQKLSPPIFFSDSAVHRVQMGNYEDHFHRLAEADWIIEAVVEDLTIKRQLMARLEGVIRPDAVISSNTSGLPIHEIAAGRSPELKKRFLGTHFFNPPRYLKLLEVIPTAETDPAVVANMVWFGEEFLGKGVVIAKDTPNFIANRIGLFMTLLGLKAIAQGYNIEEIDTLTGPLVGRPKSATFRTADLVGLDTLKSVIGHLYGAIASDERRERFHVPPLLNALVQQGALGAKAGQGFYKKVKDEKGQRQILSINPKTLQYEPAKPLNLPGLQEIAAVAPLTERLRQLYKLPGRAGDLFRHMMWDLLSYSACRLPDIADSPLAIDQAMRWGFGWQMGPFEIWDALGAYPVLNDLHQQHQPVPAWVETVIERDGSHFYQHPHLKQALATPTVANAADITAAGVGAARTVAPGATVAGTTVLGPMGARAVPKRPKALTVSALKENAQHLLWQSEAAALWAMGDGVGLFEFRSKGNTLSNGVIDGLEQVLTLLEQDDAYVGLVIGNDSDNFCGGANLVEMGQMAQTSDWAAIAHLISHFQSLLQRIHHFHKPIVAAVRGRSLGGGCELVMACPHVVAAAESYIGLVELGVGLIPGAGGIMRMVERATDRAASDSPSHIQPFMTQAFQTIALAKVSSSAYEAQQFGYLLPTARIVMNSEHRLYVAKEEVLRLAHGGYRPLPARHDIWVLGQPGRAVLTHMAYVLEQGHFASSYDRYLASRLAYVMTGGELSAPARVSADYLLQLERENFVPLLHKPKTQARMAHLLKYKKPLRN